MRNERLLKSRDQWLLIPLWTTTISNDFLHSKKRLFAMECFGLRSMAKEKKTDFDKFKKYSTY
jgi:hypothetical protein